MQNLAHTRRGESDTTSVQRDGNASRAEIVALRDRYLQIHDELSREIDELADAREQISAFLNDLIARFSKKRGAVVVRLNSIERDLQKRS